MWVGSGWKWCIYPSPKISGQFSLISKALSCLCCCHRNHFIHLYKKDNLLILKQSSDRIVIFVKGFLKLPNFHTLLKQKSPLIPRNLALRTFGGLLIVFSTKVNLLYLLYLTSSASGKATLFVENFSKNSNIDD